MSTEIYSKSLHGPLDREQLKDSLEDSLHELRKDRRNITFSFDGVQIFFNDEDQEISIVV
jgi:hypothetical protein